MVFQKIEAYAQQRYTQTTCNKRNPRVQVLARKSVLRFEVIDLCREVLEDEGQPFPCRLVQSFMDCNWIKREKLYFTIAYTERNQNALLEVTLDGKYASGYVDDPKEGAYNNMDGSFYKYLKKYADLLAQRLEEMLLNE